MVTGHSSTTPQQVSLGEAGVTAASATVSEALKHPAGWGPASPNLTACLSGTHPRWDSKAF